MVFFFCVFSLRLPLGTYWGHRLWSLISQKMLWVFSSGLKCLIAQIKFYKIRSTCKNQCELKFIEKFQFFRSCVVLGWDQWSVITRCQSTLSISHGTPLTTVTSPKPGLTIVLVRWMENNTERNPARNFLNTT